MWQEVSLSVPFEYVEPISYLFDRYGYGLSMEDDGPEKIKLRTYLPSDARQRFSHIEVGVKLASILEPLGELQVTPLDNDADWQNAWKEHFTLLRVGERLVIKPSWIDYEPEDDDILVELDPGLAFGTGYHPTTYTCLEAMEKMVNPSTIVLDLGCGSGILSIAAVKLGAHRVVALDIDPQAIQASRQNFERTHITELGGPGSGQPSPSPRSPGRFRPGSRQHFLQGHQGARSRHTSGSEPSGNAGRIRNYR